MPWPANLNKPGQAMLCPPAEPRCLWPGHAMPRVDQAVLYSTHPARLTSPAMALCKRAPFHTKLFSWVATQPCGPKQGSAHGVQHLHLLKCS